MSYQPLPRRSLGFFPTPLVKLPRLTERLCGPRLFMKRDDESGLGLGGNKVRKLEFLVGEALAKGCDTLITGGRRSPTIAGRRPPPPLLRPGLSFGPRR